MAYAMDTRCIHGEGHGNPDHNHAISYPIYQTASFSHLTPGHNPNGFDYSRESNPTRAYLEETLSSLEGAYDTIAFSSGMAAISTAFEYFQPGDHIICGEDLYGGAVRLIEQVCRKNGYEMEFADTTDPAVLKAALKKNTKAIYFETPTNPMMRITDIGVVAILKNIRLITFAESLGGTESLLTYPAVQTHPDVPEEQREKLGITDTLLRLSVGIENPDDIIADLRQAFENAGK